MIGCFGLLYGKSTPAKTNQILLKDKNNKKKRKIFRHLLVGYHHHHFPFSQTINFDNIWCCCCVSMMMIKPEETNETKQVLMMAQIKTCHKQNEECWWQRFFSFLKDWECEEKEITKFKGTKKYDQHTERSSPKIDIDR